MEKVKAGLIGCGRIGYKFDLDEKRQGIWTHAGAYAECPKIDFVGVYDNYVIVNEAAEHYGVKAYTNIEDMVKELNIISVAVNEQAHNRILEDILKVCEKTDSPPLKIVWVEKPFTGNFRIARRLIDKLADHNIHVHINYQRRFCSGFDVIKYRGAPRFATVAYVRGLYNTASHFVDMILGLYGKPVKVTVSEWNSDFVLHYHSSNCQGSDGFRVSFSMLEGLRYNICDSVFYYPTEVVKAPPLMTHLEITKTVISEQYSEYMDLGEPRKHKFLYEPMLIQVEVLVEAIETGKYYKLNNGLETLEILEQVSNDKVKFSC